MLRSEKATVVAIKQPDDPQNIPFLDQIYLFTILSRHAPLKDMGRLRRTCRAAYHHFNRQAVTEPMRMLELVTNLDVNALKKFTEKNAAIIESLKKDTSHSHAAFAAYGLLGDVSELKSDDFIGTFAWLEEQKVPNVIADCLSLVRAFKELLNPFFETTLDHIGMHHLGRPWLGHVRPLFLHFLFRTSHFILEKDDKNYAKVIKLLQTAKSHNLFAMHRDSFFAYSNVGMFGGGPRLTTSQQLIAAEINKIESQYEATHEKIGLLTKYVY